MDGFSQRIRGIAFLLSALLAAIAIVYLLADPDALAGMHPIPLIALLVLTLIVALWQAYELLYSVSP